MYFIINPLLSLLHVQNCHRLNKYCSILHYSRHYSTLSTGVTVYILYSAHTRIFFKIWIRSNILNDFSGCRRPIFKCFPIIRFVFWLAFQRRITNCSSTKTREDTTKWKRKSITMVRLFFKWFVFGQTCKIGQYLLTLGQFWTWISENWVFVMKYKSIAYVVMILNMLLNFF